MCAELDVVNVRVDDGDRCVVLRLTWAQQKAYRDGRFTPRYVPGRFENLMLDADGDAIEILDVTDQSF